MTASTASGNTTSVSFACNLNPAIGDIDLGAATGIPLPSIRVGDTFSVEVAVNTGSLFIGAFEVSVLFNPALVSFVDATKTYASGLFDRKIVNGTYVSFGGTIDGTTSSGSRFSLASLTFTAISQGNLSLGGVVVTLGQPDLAGTPIGDGTVRPFIAGQISQTILAKLGRRSLDSLDEETTAEELADSYSATPLMDTYFQRNLESFAAHVSSFVIIIVCVVSLQTAHWEIPTEIVCLMLTMFGS